MEDQTPEAPRLDLVRHIRDQIARGTYLTPKRLELALGRFLEAEPQPRKEPPATRGGLWQFSEG